TGNSHVGIPLQLSAGQLCDFFQSKRHHSLLNCRGACAKRLCDSKKHGLSPANIPKYQPRSLRGSENTPPPFCHPERSRGISKLISSLIRDVSTSLDMTKGKLPPHCSAATPA